MKNEIQVFVVGEEKPRDIYAVSQYDSAEAMASELWQATQKLGLSVYLKVILAGRPITIQSPGKNELTLAIVCLFSSTSVLVDSVADKLGVSSEGKMASFTPIEKLEHLVAFMYNSLNVDLDLDVFVEAGCDSEAIANPTVDEEDLATVFGFCIDEPAEDVAIACPFLEHEVLFWFDAAGELEEVTISNSKGERVDVYALLDCVRG